MNDEFTPYIPKSKIVKAKKHGDEYLLEDGRIVEAKDFEEKYQILWED